MEFQEIIFYFASTIIIIASLYMISVKNTVHAAFSLVLIFFLSAIIWLLLEAEFLAIILVLVYVGAVMVLFLFVVMMIDIKELSNKKNNKSKYFSFGIVVALGLLIEFLIMLSGDFSSSTSSTISHSNNNNTHSIGSVLYTEYVLAFELASVILLVAITSAIALTLRKRKKVKYQDPSKQVQVKKEDRLKLIKMD
ncbi:MAG: NADH-quinone oxidoreductase subunit J [Pseudomonadota bacterium]